jgi:hypothetical protein
MGYRLEALGELVSAGSSRRSHGNDNEQSIESVEGIPDRPSVLRTTTCDWPVSSSICPLEQPANSGSSPSTTTRA